MGWTTLIFWTLDIIASCLTGYIREGRPDMNPLHVLKHYLRTWFVLDLILVGPDWLFKFLQVGEDENADQSDSSGSGAGKLLRALRVMRVARLLRLVKLQRL